MHSFKRFALLAALLVALPAAAANIQVDVPAGTTQCGFYLDSSTVPSLVPAQQVAGSTTGTICKYNVQLVTPGPHVVVADSRKTDPIWGTVISPKSAPPFPFEKPGATGIPPTNFLLVP